MASGWHLPRVRCLHLGTPTTRLMIHLPSSSKMAILAPCPESYKHLPELYHLLPRPLHFDPIYVEKFSLPTPAISIFHQSTHDHQGPSRG